MNETEALAALAAMSQETRLRILKHLIAAGPTGVPAGAVAEHAGVSASNVSFHLKELERAGLVTGRREQRSIIYTVEFAAVRDLIRFLMDDCCSGHPEICAPIWAAPGCRPQTKEPA